MTRFSFLILLCFGPLQFVFAQPEPNPPPELKLSLRFFPIHRQPIDGLFLPISPGEFVPVEFRSRMRSREYEYRGPRRFPLCRREFDQEKGEYIYTPEFYLTSPTTSGDVLIMVMPPGNISNQDLGDAWMVIPIDDSPETFKPSQIRVLNATGYYVEGVIDDDRVSLDFGLSEPIKKKANKNWLDIAFAIQVKKEYELIYGNRMQFNSMARSILVLRPPQRPRSIQIDTYLLEDMPGFEDTEGLPARPAPDESEVETPTE